MVTFFRGKNILVTGGSGVIGQQLIKQLIEQGAYVRNVDFRSQPKLLTDLGVEQYIMDLSNSLTQPFFRFEPNYLFHLAADFERSTETKNFWDSNFKNNVLASRNILEEAIKYDSLQKIVFASSYLIYDKKLYSNPNDPRKLKETDAIDPRNLCGMAKLQTEADLEFLAKFYNVDVACARIFRVYGRDSRDVISRWIKGIQKGREITVFGENNKFDYIFADDAAEGLLKLGSAKTQNTVYNLGSGKYTGILEVVEVIKKSLGKEIKICGSDEEIFPEGSYADMTQFERDIKWMPPTNIEEGIKILIDYYRGLTSIF